MVCNYWGWHAAGAQSVGDGGRAGLRAAWIGAAKASEKPQASTAAPARSTKRPARLPDGRRRQPGRRRARAKGVAAGEGRCRAENLGNAGTGGKPCELPPARAWRWHLIQRGGEAFIAPGAKVSAAAFAGEVMPIHECMRAAEFGIAIRANGLRGGQRAFAAGALHAGGLAGHVANLCGGARGKCNARC